MKRKLGNQIFILSFSFWIFNIYLVSAQCPHFTNSVFNTNCGAPCIVCLNQDITLGVSGSNIPSGTCVNWYYSNSSGFNPYNGEGTYINCTLINGPGMFYSSFQPNESMCNSGLIYIFGILDPAALNGCPEIFTNEFGFFVECITASASVGGMRCYDSDVYLFADGGVTYNWSGPNGFSSNQQNPTIMDVTELNEGTYYVTVTSVHGCTDVTSVYVKLYPPLILDIFLPTEPWVICEGGNDSISVTVVNPGSGSIGVTGWSLNYDFWNIISKDFTIKAEWDAYYYFHAEDLLSGCTYSIDYVVEIRPSPDVSIEPDPSHICPGGNLEIIANATGGSEPYDYLWNTKDSSQSIFINNPGIYHVTVTDIYGCSDSAKLQVPLGSPLEVTLNPYINVFCNGNDNLITAITTGGVIPYDYLWNTPIGDFTGADINANIPGNYKVTVFDILGCKGTASIKIKENPDITISITPDSIICNNNFKKLSASATGGSGSKYQYIWTTPGGKEIKAATIDPNELGTYIIMVLDSLGCNKKDSIKLILGLDLDAKINPSPAEFCTGGSVLLNPYVQGGSSYYTFKWTTPKGDNLNKNILADTFGFYYVTITDKYGCIGKTEVEVTKKEDIPVSIFPDSSTICYNDTLILHAVSSDSGNLVFKWKTPIGSLNGDSINVIKGGTYTLIVSNENGCTGMALATIKEIPLPGFAQLPDSSILCIGESIEFNVVTTDTGVLVSIWDTPLGPIYGNSITITKAGDYIYNLTNSYGCTNSDTILVLQNDSIKVSISPDPASFCPGHNIKLTASTTAPGLINYNWSTPDGAQSSSVITTNVAGNYTVTITNSNGCSGSASVNVSESQGLIVTIDPGNAGFCTGNSIDLTANATGAKLSYLWAFPGGANSTNQTINTNKSGTYTVTVTDEGGCTGTATIEVQEYAGLDIKIDPDPASFCNNGSVVLTAINNNGVGPFTYEWSTPIGSASASTFNANTIGTYSVTVTDANACSGTATTQVSQSSSLSLSFIPTKLGFCPGKSIDLSVKANGGQQPYVYSWNTPLGNYNSNSINTNTAGVYLVTVTDVNGCSGLSDAEIKAFSEPIIDLTPALGFCPGNAVNIKANVSDVQTPLLYSWDTPSGSNKLDSFLVNTPGNYYLTVTNAVGCSAIASTKVEKWDIPYIKYSPFPVEFCNGKSVIVTAGATIGLAPFSYFWQGPSANYTGSPLTIYESGKYYLTVTDAHGCTSNINLTANELPGFAVSISTDPDVLCGALPFNIISQVQGGNAPYIYDWHTPTGTEATANFLSNDFGNYTVTVTDIKGCVGIDTLLIKADSLSVVLDKTDPGCISLKAGSITLLSATNPSFPMQLVLNNKSPVIINSLPYLLNTLSAGTYHINITGDNGCKQSLNLELTETSTPSLKLGEDVTIFLGETYTIMPTASFIIDSINWTNKSSLNCNPGCLEPIASPTVNTTYRATAYSKDGCKAVDDINIYVVEKESVYVPNSFSPNGDGINDKFVIYTDNSVKQVKKLYIYDRWGESVFLQNNFPPNDPDYGWNGKFREQYMNTAVFIYYLQVEFNDGRVKEFKGDINLIR